jgi:hypothetical protein
MKSADHRRDAEGAEKNWRTQRKRERSFAALRMTTAKGRVGTCPYKFNVNGWRSEDRRYKVKGNCDSESAGGTPAYRQAVRRY